MGLLLLMLFALAYFAKASVEAEVETAAEKRLEKAGYAWTKVSADGQELLITGTTTRTVDEKIIAALAGTTECDTWAGDLTCPTRVRVDITRVKPPPPTAPPARAHDFSFELSQGVVTLSGEVPSESDRRRLVQGATAAFGKINDKLRVTNGRPTEDYEKAYTTAISLLQLLVTGKAAWQSGKFGASGVVIAGKEDEAQALLRSFGGDALGSVSFLKEQEAKACDEDFAARLETKIQFPTGSAEIQPQSMGLLRELAEIAKRCPVTLQIEGHTDSTGAEAFNDKLSRDRAESVKQALKDLQIEAERLVALGFGQHRPIGDNRTNEGRAANRRIEIKIRR